MAAAARKGCDLRVLLAAPAAALSRGEFLASEFVGF
jgi:hypothetical protein